MADYQGLKDAILTGDSQSAVEITRQAIDDGASPMDLVTDYMIPAMDEVGQKFECEEYFIPELLISARAMKGSLDIIRPLLSASGVEPTGRVVIGTVKGDLHDIGKNLVTSMLEGGGFEVHDLGVDVPAEKFIEKIKETKAQLLCLSTLLTTTMPSMKSTIESLSQAGVRDQVKVLVGGAPVTQSFADEIQADAYGENARRSVLIARELIAAN